MFTIVKLYKIMYTGPTLEGNVNCIVNYLFFFTFKIFHYACYRIVKIKQTWHYEEKIMTWQYWRHLNLNREEGINEWMDVWIGVLLHRFNWLALVVD